MSQELEAVLIGSAIGIVSASLGAVVSYILYMRQDKENTRGPLIVMLIVDAVLVVVGLVVIVFSVFANQLVLAILTGIAVFISFALAFGVLLFLSTRFL